MNACQLMFAMFPLAIYFAWLALVNLRNRPTVTSGTAELIRLAGAISGLVLVGPLQLFMPEEAAFRLGAWVWFPLLSLFGLLLLFIVLNSRPRIVIYNVDSHDLAIALANVSETLGETSEVSGSMDSLRQSDPCGLVDSWPMMKSHTILPASNPPTAPSWMQFRRALANELSGRRGKSNPIGWAMLLVAASLLAAPYFCITSDTSSMLEMAARILRIELPHQVK